MGPSCRRGHRIEVALRGLRFGQRVGQPQIELAEVYICDWLVIDADYVKAYLAVHGLPKAIVKPSALLPIVVVPYAAERSCVRSKEEAAFVYELVRSKLIDACEMIIDRSHFGTPLARLGRVGIVEERHRYP